MTEMKWLTTSAGVKMPWIVYGTAWKKERTADLVVSAVQAGFRGIDTAGQPRHYDEPRVGEALGRLKAEGIGREDLFLQTKFTPLAGHDPERIPYDPDAPLKTQVAQSFASSQQNLGAEVVDSLVLHSPIEPHAALMEVWGAMEEIHRAGGARQLGISNCYDPGVIERLYAESEVRPAVLQNRFYKATGYDAELRRFCADRGVVYQSFWTLTANPHVLAHEAVLVPGQKYGKTPAQVFFRYLSHSGIVPLTGTSSEQHMREDLDVLDFELSDAEQESIGALLVPG
jgi:diketogulonate reductase-like aldo/keto reductase